MGLIQTVVECVWLRVDLEMDVKKTCLQESGLCVHSLLTILDSIANIIEGINDNENFHFDDE